MRVIGHRGTPTGPRSSENTLPALRAALEAGADGFEIDVRATRDGVLVLCHDPDLGRVLGTGAGTGPVVARSTAAALRALRLPHGARVPILGEALDLAAAHRACVVTEVKRETGPDRLRTARLLAALLRERRRRRPGADRVITSSFDPLVAVALAGHGTAGGAVILEPHVEPGPPARRARGQGLTELHLGVQHVRRDPSVVARLHALGLRVAAGIVDDPEEARALARLGVDLLCTDAPDRVVHREVVHREPVAAAAAS
ncbi:MAG TPA: glycerophosphodiester phosphodiesterase [Geodermatophilus sp.]|nr:glycerophosphodiester phosphodiesterase [Geodermatophilus sp.]